MLVIIIIIIIIIIKQIVVTPIFKSIKYIWLRFYQFKMLEKFRECQMIKSIFLYNNKYTIPFCIRLH